MFTVTVIGNLGADARKVVENGSEFISFNVAHTDKFKGQDGREVESTEWISCTINGNRDNLLPYLTRGTKVFVTGRGQSHLYSSPKLKRMVAGTRCFVDRLELVGGSSEAVPRNLATADGEVTPVQKYYQVNPTVAKKAGATKDHDIMMYSERGTAFIVNKDGWVKQREINVAESNEETQAAQSENQ